MTLPRTLVLAVRSGQLHGRTLAVFVELHEWIDTERYQPVKAWYIAQQLGMSQNKVYRAIRALRALGYIECGERLGTAYTYRLARRAERAA